jgi:hypothetical protein
LTAGDPNPADVLEGSLRDCFFIAAVSVLAQQPFYIRRLFRSQELTPAGAYAFNLFYDNQWRVMVVDDSLPCRPNSGKPAFGCLRSQNQVQALTFEAVVWGSVQ